MIKIAVFIVYLVFIFCWGLYNSLKVKTEDDYIIAERKLPGWVSALSERAAGESAWALLGLPGFAYTFGLGAMWPAIGCVGGIITAWIFLSWRLRREAENYNVKTYIDYLSKRHKEVGHWIKLFGAITIVFFFTFYVGAQFLGGGKILHLLFEIDPIWGMIISAIVILPYAAYGGFRSVVYVDVLQALLMIATLVITPIAGLYYISTAPDVFSSSMFTALHISGDKYTSITGGFFGFSAGIFIASEFSWFFGYLGGLPQLSIRFMAIKNEKEAKIGRNIGVLWTIFAYIGALLIGWIGISIFGPTSIEDPEYIMPSVVLKLFPPFIAALFITGAVAAMLSTADSLIILTATEMSESIIKPITKRDLSIKILRLITAMIALLALLLVNILPSDLIYEIVGYVWAGIGCTFSVVILMTFFWEKFTSQAALTSIIVGLFFTILWIWTGLESFISSRIMTFIITFIVAILSNLYFKKNTH